jgi:hypothetical protein
VVMCLCVRGIRRLSGHVFVCEGYRESVLSCMTTHSPDTLNTQIHDHTLDTPNTQIHDHSLDTPNTKIHDHSLS